MFTQTTATVLGALLFVFLIVLDIWAARDDSPGNAPSQLIRSLSRHTAILPWAVGVLNGHWFHPRDDLDPVLGSASVWVLIGLSVVVLLWRFVFRRRDLVGVWIWAVLGTIAGTLLWPV